MIRRTARVLGLAALISPALVAFTAGTAQAAQSISSPSDGQVYSSAQSVSVSGSFAGCGGALSSCPSGTLTVTDPSGTTVANVTKKSTNNTSSTAISTNVSLSASTKNGAYKVTLTSGSTTSSTKFYTNIAPATPSGFDASATDGDPHDILLSWSKGSEPDLTGYTVYDGNGSVLQDGINARSACSGSSCSYSLYYDNPTPGTYNYSFALSASRSGGCASGTCASLESGKTSSRSASLTTPVPPPSPTPEPTQSSTTGGSTAGGTGGSNSTTGGSNSGSTGGGTGTGSSGGSTKGSTGETTTPTSPVPLPTLNPAVASRALALNFSNFSSSLGIPKLPPLPKTDVVLPSGEGPIPAGTYDPSLPYSPKSETVKTTHFLSDPIGSVTSVEWKNVARPLAIALILVLCAAHLRRWIGAHIEE